MKCLKKTLKFIACRYFSVYFKWLKYIKRIIMKSSHSTNRYITISKTLLPCFNVLCLQRGPSLLFIPCVWQKGVERFTSYSSMYHFGNKPVCSENIMTVV